MIRQTEVDGVPTLIAATDGPMAAGLVFRVGMADETLPVSGITHLVEHLALHRHGVVDYHYNGATSATETHFGMQGSPEDVVTYLTGVCQGLANLPLERLDTEKSILQTEANGRRPRLLPRVRHGARDYGLTGYPEWGLHQLRPEDVRSWAATWFTRGNAVLWIAGNGIPPGLRLNLPDGHRYRLPEPSAALPAGPTFVTTDTDGVSFDGLVDRGAAAMVYAEVLQRRLFRDLRHEGGYSYTVGTGYERRGDRDAVVMAAADAHPEAYHAVIGGMVDAIASLRAGHVDPRDLDGVKAQFREALSRPDAAAQRLPSVAVDLLAGGPIRQPAELLAEIEAVDRAAVVHSARQSWERGLLMVADGEDVGWTGFTGISARRQSVTPVAGREFTARDDAERRLVLGREGVALRSPMLTSTVRFADCAALLAWPDGARQLVGADGVTIAIEPTRFGLDPVAVSTLTAGAHPSRVVWMPARNPAEVPTETSWTAAPDRPRTPRRPEGPPPGKGSAVGLAVLYLLAVPLSLFMLLALLGSVGDPQADAATWVVLFVLTLVPAGLWTWIILITRRRRRYRSR